MDPILEYTNLLHRCGGPDSREAKEFIERHRADRTFVHRAEMVNRLFHLREPAPAGVPDRVPSASQDDD